MNLFEHIKILLANNERYNKEGKLFKNIIVEDSLKLEPKLLSLLLSDEKAKKHFFSEVNNIFIFDKIKFQKFISNKQFLPNSYTAFKNKIGLTANNEFLTEAKEVVLAWPYKDCILEGAQTKEDEKRQEIFWNETLAPDEIDRLLEPKVLTNFKKYDKNGEHLVNNITLNNNLIIKGNNLLTLHSLKKIYKGKIKLIYIDPPYNTGNDSFNYNDSFNHSTWLTFMKNRLEIAWELLNKEGSIFIQVDDGEFSYLKILCDEIFGRGNFRETIVLKSSTESGVNAINVKRGERLFKVKEYILFYSKSTSFRFKPFYTKTNYNLNYKYEVIKKNDRYIVKDLLTKFKEDYKNLNLNSKEKDILIKTKFIDYALKNPNNIYSLEKNIKKAGEKFKEFALKNKTNGGVDEYLNSKNEIKLLYQGGVFVPLKERIVKDDKGNHFGILASDLWTDIGTTPSNEGGIKFSNGKKPEKLLKRIIEMVTKKGDIVLDYHLGSGTTAAVSHKMGRRYIGLEQLDYGKNDSTIRLQNVIKGEQTGISKTLNWKGGGSFIYAELAKNNEKIIDSITKSKKTNELINIFNKLRKSYFIKYSINTLLMDKNLNKFKNLDINNQKKVLIDLLDKNELYINYEDIENNDFDIDKKDKELNYKFYKK